MKWSHVLTFAPLVAFMLSSCGGSSSVTDRGGTSLPVVRRETGGTSTFIKHVVIVIQENRSFDDFFATFPGADGTTGGCMKLPPESGSGSGGGGCPVGDDYVPLEPVNLAEPCDFSHSRLPYLHDYDGGLMDGFGLEGNGPAKCGPGIAGKEVYQFVIPTQIAPYWTLAQQYVLGDHMFQTQGSGSFTAHQDLIAGTTTYNPAKTMSLVDFPSHQPWGCDAPKGTKTTILVDLGSMLKDEWHKGPFPCMSYPTIRDLLDAHGITWRYYSPPEPVGDGKLWNAFNAIKAVRNGPEWNVNIAHNKVFFNDVAAGRLPNVSWVIPDTRNSDHPGGKTDTGPSWVGNIVNTIGTSPYWSTTAIVVVWDDWGGFYDHVPPPFFDRWGGLGFRVPMLLISPYAREARAGKPGYISHTTYEFGSILKFVEQNWNLGTLGATDSRAASLIDCFDFTQSPRPFTQVLVKYSRSYFLHQPYSYKPIDTE
ncbi:MAG TPA: alkaline phosphatase family protein [Candidatus Cybelea sp.]|nr:alkaline phosphatase family protein [Candidatus Cybelea sp.]